MLELEDVGFHGHHAPLLENVSASIGEGTLSEITAPTGDARTALALICSGRAAPDSGRVLIHGAAETARLRRSTALIDSPGITAPEHHMRARDLISESLGLIPRRRGIRIPATAQWIAEQEVADIADRPVDSLPSELRLWMMAELAFADPQVELVVLDSPDRHDISAEGLSETLELTAEPSERTVLAILAQEVLR